MDRIHDSEMNSTERELAALRKSVKKTVDDMKRAHAKSLTESLRHDKQFLLGISIIFGLVIFHLVGDLLWPPPPAIAVTATCSDPVVEGARRQRDRDALGPTMIRSILGADLYPHSHVDPACLTLVTTDWPDLSFDEIVNVCSTRDE